MTSSTYNGPRDNMLYHKTHNTMYTALTDMTCTLLQCNVCTHQPVSAVEQLVKGQRSHPTLKPHMHNSLNHLLSLTVCMALTLFLCRTSAPKFSHSSCTRSLWPSRPANWTAVLPFWGRGCKKVHQMLCCQDTTTAEAMVGQECQRLGIGRKNLSSYYYPLQHESCWFSGMVSIQCWRLVWWHTQWWTNQHRHQVMHFKLPPDHVNSEL